MIIEDLSVFKDAAIIPVISEIRMLNFNLSALVLFESASDALRCKSAINQMKLENFENNRFHEQIEAYWAYRITDLKNYSWYGVTLRAVPNQVTIEKLKNHCLHKLKSSSESYQNMQDKLISFVHPLVKVKSYYCSLVVVNNLDTAEKLCVEICRKQDNSNGTSHQSSKKMKATVHKNSYKKRSTSTRSSYKFMNNQCQNITYQGYCFGEISNFNNRIESIVKTEKPSIQINESKSNITKKQQISAASVESSTKNYLNQSSVLNSNPTIQAKLEEIFLQSTSSIVENKKSELQIQNHAPINNQEESNSQQENNINGNVTNGNHQIAVKEKVDLSSLKNLKEMLEQSISTKNKISVQSAPSEIMNPVITYNLSQEFDWSLLENIDENNQINKESIKNSRFLDLSKPDLIKNQIIKKYMPEVQARKSPKNSNKHKSGYDSLKVLTKGIKDKEQHHSQKHYDWNKSRTSPSRKNDKKKVNHSESNGDSIKYKAENKLGYNINELIKNTQMQLKTDLNINYSHLKPKNESKRPKRRSSSRSRSRDSSRSRSYRDRDYLRHKREKERDYSKRNK